jgi:hypothetical protein
MRVAATVLGVFGGMILYDHAYVGIRLGQVLAGTEWSVFIVGPLLLFCCWIVATGLAYQFPAQAVWAFAIGGVVGVYSGIVIDRPVILAGGVAANLLAVATTFARREKRAADRRDWADEHRLAVATNALVALRRAVESPAGEERVMLSFVPLPGEPERLARPPAPVSIR